MVIAGQAIVLGDNINTDLLHPPSFFSADSGESARGAFAGLDLDISRLGPSPYIIIGRKNFGCGSSRESTLIALKKIGVVAIVAESFSHIFSRNATNQGLWTFRIPETSTALISGDSVSIDMDQQLFRSSNGDFPVTPPADFEKDIILSGGLIPYLDKREWQWT